MNVFPKLNVNKTYTQYKPGRDIALDVVRSWSLLVVVVGHFVMMIIFWEPGNVVRMSNTLSSGDLWPWVTWIMQVMPLFFIAGGAVNKTSWEHFNGTYSQWLWQRLARLLRPTIVFLSFVAILALFATLFTSSEVSGPLITGITGPLWFLAVYIPVTDLTPLTAKWFNETPAISVGVLFFLSISVDVLRFNISTIVGVLNLLIAWTFVHQLGYWYNSGVKKQIATGLIVGGLLMNFFLTKVIGWYPTSLVGIPTEKFSNMAPPTVILVFHSIVLFGLLCILAPWIRKVFVKEKLLKATIVAGMMAMTVYLWHMLVLFGWLTLLHFMSLDLPTRKFEGLVLPENIFYWAWLVPVLVGFLTILYVVVRFLWPLEYIKLPGFDTRVNRIPSKVSGLLMSIFATIFVSLGILAIAGGGFSGFPLQIKDMYGVPVNAGVALFFIFLGIWLARKAGNYKRVE